MPQALPFLIAAAKQIALAVAQAAIAYGVSELLGLNDAPDAESQKFPVKQPVPPMQYAYGEGRLSGSLLYWRTIRNVSIDVIALCVGPVQSIDSFYLNDDAVTMDGDIVAQGPDGRYRRSGAENDTIRILSRLGSRPSPAYAEVIAASEGEWTEDHRADGVATMAIIAKGVKTELVQVIYPNGPVQGSAVGHWARCYDWRADSTMPGGDGPQRRDDPSTWAWTRNPVVCHVHNEWAVYGQDFDYRFLPTLAQLTVAADVCEEQIPLKAGGTIDRYRMFGFFNSRTPPKQVRQLFMQTYDGIWIERGDGAFVVKAGIYVPPTVVLTEDRIRRFRWRRIRRQEDICNSLVIAYNSPDHDFTMVETQPWQDAASVAALGEYPQPFELKWVDNNSQARRLAKATFSRINAEYDGFVEIDLSDDESELEQAYFQIQNRAAPASMWDVEVRVTSMTLDLAQRLVRIEFIKADPTAYDWDAATEEGDGPGVAPSAPPQTVDVPVIDSVVVEFSSGSPRLLIGIDDPGRDDYGVTIRWAVVGASDGQVQEFPEVDSSGDPWTMQSSVLPAGVSITLEVAFVSTGGIPGEFVAWPDPLSTVEGTPQPSALTADVAGDDVTVGWRYPQTPFAYVRLKRSATPVYADAAFLTGEFTGGLGQMDFEVDENLAPGAYWYWILSYDDDDVPSDPVGPVQGNVTLEVDANLLTAPSDYTNAAWEKGHNGTGSDPVVTANAGTAPDGTATADRVQFVTAGLPGDASDHSYMRQLVAGANGAQHGVWWIKSNTGADQTLYVRVADDNYVVTAKPYWLRFPINGASSDRKLWAGLRGNLTGAVASADVLLWQGHLAMD